MGTRDRFQASEGPAALPKRIATEHDVEAKALTKRVDIQAARHALARQLGLTNVTRYVRDVSLTLQDDKEWVGNTGGLKVATQSNDKLVRNGFVVDFTIPIYDFGESKVRNALPGCSPPPIGVVPREVVLSAVAHVGLTGLLGAGVDSPLGEPVRRRKIGLLCVAGATA